MYNTSDLKGVIPKDYGVGVKWKKDGSEYVTIAPKYPRVLRLDISSFRGISPGARHFYGKFRSSWLSFKVLKTNCKYYKVGQIICGSGFGQPDEVQSFNLEVVRPVTRKDVLSGDFEHYRVGAMTDRFDTKESLIRKAKRVFETHFKDGWKLEIDK